MLSKKYRLSENEVKKVLRKGKPFFSSRLHLQLFPQKLGYSRFAIVIGGKSVENAVVRNIYRRYFYQIAEKLFFLGSFDIVCVVKSKTRLNPDEENKKLFSQEIYSLIEKKLGKNT